MFSRNRRRYTRPLLPTLPADVHRGRPVDPEHRRRGEELMHTWAAEDAASACRVHDIVFTNV